MPKRGKQPPPTNQPPPTGGVDLNNVSRKLTQLLRHRLHENGLSDVLRPDGYVPLERVLQLPQFASRHVTVEQVREIVRTNDKQRMALTEDGDKIYIRANQGHTADGIDADALLQRVSQDDAASLAGGRGLALHGTYHSAWPAIVSSGGLKTMQRHHIHLAVGLPGDAGVISGMRASSEVLIWVDVARAVQAGIRFYTSANHVVLTPGRDGDGLLPLDFFARVVDAKTGREWRDDGWQHGSPPSGSEAAWSSSSIAVAAPARPPAVMDAASSSAVASSSAAHAGDRSNAGDLP